MWIDLMAYLGGGLTMISFVPQLIQSVKTKKTNDISWGMLILTFLAGIFYEIYAIALVLKPVIIMNGIFIVVVSFMMFIKFIYNKGIDREL